MFKCDDCNKSTEPNESMNYFVSKRRNREYYTAILRHKRSSKKIILYKRLSSQEMYDLNKMNIELISEKTTKGWEIEKELKLCKDCYTKRTTPSNQN